MNTPSGGGRAQLIAIVAAGAVLLTACGTTYVDTSATTLSPDTVPAVDPGTPVDELLTEIESLMLHLDERIVEGDAPAATLARIEELWGVAEPQVRDVALDSVYQFEVALDLARSGVQRKRPADASKGYKLMRNIVAAFPHASA